MPTNDKFDAKKDLECYRAPRGKFRVVDVPTMQYLMVDGEGDPNTSSDFADAVQALYPVAYTMKFASKKKLDRDYVVPPLEGLWWADDMNSFTVARNKSQWQWTLMILVPDWLDDVHFHDAVRQVEAKANPRRLADVRLQELAEGKCVQTLHVGSFDDEGPVLEQMHDVYLPECGLEPAGKHHEIYFSDFRKVEPAKLRTIVRHPVQTIGRAAD